MGRTPAHRAPTAGRPTPTAVGGAAAISVALVVLAQTLLLEAGGSASARASTGVEAASSAGSESVAATTSRAAGQGGVRSALTRGGTPLIALVGDSYMNGKGAPEGKGMGVLLTRRLDADVANFAEGGTGWADDGPDAPATASYDEHADEVLASKPDLVVVAGGYNDHAAINKDLLSYDDVAVNARSLLTSLAEAKGVRTVVFGPFWVNGDPPISLLLLRDVLQDAAESAGAAWVDPIAEGWIDGDRRDMTGNAARFIRKDRIHPTAQGHRYFAKRMAKAIQALG